MDLTSFIADVYLRATGKTTALTSGTTKYNRILNLANYFTREWARERGGNWNTLYNPALSIGTVTATDTFDLDTSTIQNLSNREGDVVRIMWTDDVGYTDYDIIPADKLKDFFWGQNKESYSNFYCTKIGGQLVFNHTFTSSDSQYGGDIQVPCYVFPDELANADDEIQVDDPDWLVVRTAAEYVRNDITRQNQYPNLLSEANEKMQKMKEDNEGQVALIDIPWVAPGGLGSGDAWSS